MNRALRIVFDTNVVVSALVFKTPGSSWLRSTWIGQPGSPTTIPLASGDTVRELLRVLNYPKFKLDDKAVEGLLHDYLPFVEQHRSPHTRAKLPPCRDPDDLKFLVLAYAARADALVSGDADLLAVAGQSRIPILTLAELRARLIGEASASRR